MHRALTRHVLTAWAPSLTGLTCLSMASRANVNDYELALVAPFLSSLTHLDLSSTGVGDEGMRSLGRLTALIRLELDKTAITDRGVRLLAPLAAHLTQLALGGEECGDAEMIAVCSLTALTHLEMLDLGVLALSLREGTCAEGLRALSSLTSLIHFELDNVTSDEAVRALSSLTTICHLRLLNPCYSDEGMRALACLTALTYLDIRDTEDVEYDGFDMDLSDQGARALRDDGAVRDDGVKALAALTALTALYLDCNDGGDEGVKGLVALTALTELDIDFTEVSDVGLRVLYWSLSLLLLGGPIRG